jgi:hypothetical protein
MIPGPILIIPCPQCANLGKKRTLISGNTFGAELWSDGKRIAPMLPEYPSFVKCRKCGTFFFIKDSDAQTRFTWSDRGKDKWPYIDFFEFPTFNEYIEALGKVDDEKYLRLLIFRSFNDCAREGKDDEISEDMQMLHEDNLKSLLYLLTEEDIDELLTKIEINRELGRFEKCLELLQNINSEKHEWLIVKFSNEILKKNKKVFRLN